VTSTNKNKLAMDKKIFVRNKRDKNTSPVKKFKREIEEPTMISLFSGCGGSSDGYHQAKFKELLALEWDKNARECFSLNFPDVPVVGSDIQKLTGCEILDMIKQNAGELDLFDASPPCQSLSTANVNRNPFDARGKLFLKTIGLIGEVQPKVFLIENVTGLIKGKNLMFYNMVFYEANKLNYYCEYKVIKAEEYGVPQLRRRVIMIGIRGDIHRKFGPFKSFPEPDIEGAKKMRVCDFLPHITAFSPGQFKDRITFSDQPVCTITKTASMWVYEKDGIRRKPTIEELKVLSTFRNDFQFTGSFVQQWARIGNAVPPNMTKALAEHIRDKILTPAVLEYADSEEALEYAADLAFQAIELNNRRAIDLRRKIL